MLVTLWIWIKYWYLVSGRCWESASCCDTGLIPPSSCLPISANLVLHPVLCLTPDYPLALRLHSGTREIGQRCCHSWGHNLWVSWRPRSTFLCGVVSAHYSPYPLGNLWLIRKAKTCHLLLCLLISNYNLVQKVSRSSGIRLPLLM